MTTNNLDMSDLSAAILTPETINAVKAKLNADFLAELPPKVQKRVELLKEFQSEHDEYEAKFLEERRVLEDKYQKLYQPLYNKRYDVVNGIVEVDGVSIEQVADKPTEEKGVPHFWLTAMKTNDVLGESIQEQDEEALKYLKDIKYYRIDLSKDDIHKGAATKGFKLEFFFDPNPYFKNSVLTKTYYMIDEDDPILERAIGTQIEWFPGKSLIEKVVKRKPKKGSKSDKPIIKTEKIDSFFNFFYPPEVPEGDEEIDEEVADELQALMEQDYDVGSTIREKLIPHAVSWFTGEAADDDDDDLGGLDLDDDDEDEEDDDDDEDDGEDEDDDEDEDDEEDEDDDKTNSQKKKGGAKAVAGGQQAVERPPECKQQ